MTTRCPIPLPPLRFRTATAAFTLVEVIGAMAIVAILAAIVVPTTVRSIDRAAVRAEAETLRALGEQVRLFLRQTGAAPSPTTWTTDLAPYADRAPAQLQLNSRQNNRTFILDPAASPAPRALILSSMRAGLAVPTSAAINTALRFEDIWQTPDGHVPSIASWSGWSAWHAVNGAGDYLVIERIALRPIHLTDLRAVAVALNNRDSVAATYRVVPAHGPAHAPQTLAAGGSVVLTSLRPRDRLDLFRPGHAAPDYSYTVNLQAPPTFEFEAGRWLAR